MSGIGAVYIPDPVNVPDFDRGSCRGNARTMNPNPGNRQGIAKARRVCSGCPVLADCRTWMTTLTPTEDPGGMLAGVTWEERTGKDKFRRMCRSCLRVLPLDRFSAGRSGRRASCKPCVAVSRASSMRHPNRRADEAAA